jgi:hypothetical protein
VPDAIVTYSGLYAVADVLADDLKYMELDYAGVELDYTHVATPSPAARYQILSAVKSGAQLLLSTYFGAGKGTCAATQIASVTNASQFTVTTGEGSLLQPDQLIRVNNLENRVIDTVAGDVVTLTTPLGFTPAPLHSVTQMIAGVTLWGGADADHVIGSGRLFGRALLLLPRYKQANNGLDLTLEVLVGS